MVVLVGGAVSEPGTPVNTEGLTNKQDRDCFLLVRPVEDEALLVCFARSCLDHITLTVFCVYSLDCAFALACTRQRTVQGYLAHKKTPPPRTLQ